MEILVECDPASAVFVNGRLKDIKVNETPLAAREAGTGAVVHGNVTAPRGTRIVPSPGHDLLLAQAKEDGAPSVRIWVLLEPPPGVRLRVERYRGSPLTTPSSSIV